MSFSKTKDLDTAILADQGQTTLGPDGLDRGEPTS